MRNIMPVKTSAKKPTDRATPSRPIAHPPVHEAGRWESDQQVTVVVDCWQHLVTSTVVGDDCLLFTHMCVRGEYTIPTVVYRQMEKFNNYRPTDATNKAPT